MTHRATDPEFQARFVAAAARRAKGPPLRLELDVGAALTIVAQLQLALRHPGNTGRTATLSEGFVRQLISRLAAGPDADTLRAGLMAGFDRTQDQACATSEQKREWFRTWYRAMPTEWQAGMWDVLLDGGAFLGELPANPAAGLRAVGVLFMPWEVGQRMAKMIEEGGWIVTKKQPD